MGAPPESQAAALSELKLLYVDGYGEEHVYAFLRKFEFSAAYAADYAELVCAAIASPKAWTCAVLVAMREWGMSARTLGPHASTVFECAQTSLCRLPTAILFELWKGWKFPGRIVWGIANDWKTSEFNMGPRVAGEYPGAEASLAEMMRLAPSAGADDGSTREEKLGAKPPQ